MTFVDNQEIILLIIVTFMGNIDRELFTNELLRQNPWWIDRRAMAEDPKIAKRDIYEEVLERVSKNELITAVTGLRRVGKTTLIRQIINNLLSETTDRQKITYFSFEEATIAAIPELLERIITYQLKKHPHGKLYFFFDEIQYVNLWNAILKKYFDSERRLKFVITGSSSLFIKTSAYETLAGRILETIMYPLSFGEYLRLFKKTHVPHNSMFSYEKLFPYKEILEEEFFNYITFGEFPYLVKLSSFSDQKQYILDWVIAKIVESDLPKMRRFVRADELSNLSNSLISGSGQLVEFLNLASDFHLDRKTLAKYIDLLVKTRLIGAIFNYGGSFRTRSIRQRKIYPSSVNALVFKITSGIGTESFLLKIGQIVENFVFNYLWRMGDKLYFWRQRGREVDFILETSDGIMPIEVKYQSKVKKDDLKNLIYFGKKKKLKRVLVVTKNDFGKKIIDGLEVNFIPAYYMV